MKKQLLTASLLLSLTAVYGDCTPEPVYKPPECCAHNPPKCCDVFLSSPCYTFEASFTALYMQPSASNLDYAAEAEPLDFSAPVPAVSPNWIIHEISPDYHFGFDVGIASLFHGSNSILTLNWERFHSPKDSNSKTVVSTSMVGPFFEIGPDASYYKKVKGSVDFHFDEINLDYGTFVSFGERLHMNLFAGASFARIVQHLHTKFSSLGNSMIRTIKVPSRFTGGGPQLGLDFTYRIAKGFQFTGNSRATLFIGRLKNKTTFSSTTPSLTGVGPNPNVQTTTVKNRTGLVPGFEGKLGLAYDFEFCCRYMFRLEAGYQAQIYLNSIRSIDMGSEVALETVGTGISGDMGVYARTFHRTISDFSLAGPYLTIDFGF